MSLVSWLNCVTMYVRPCSIGDIVRQYVTVYLANMSLFAWTICHCLLGQYVTVSLVNMSLFTWAICHCLLGQYVTVYLGQPSVQVRL